MEKMLGLLFITVASFVMYLASPSRVKRSPFLGKDCASESCASCTHACVGISTGSFLQMVL